MEMPPMTDEQCTALIAALDRAGERIVDSLGDVAAAIEAQNEILQTSIDERKKWQTQNSK